MNSTNHSSPPKHNGVIPGAANVAKELGKCKAALYNDIKSGLFPPLFKLGPRKSAARPGEIDAINAARIAGKSPDEIRAVVAKLIADRAALA